MAQQNKPPLTFFLLTMILVGSTLSIDSWPFMVECGFSAIFYLLAAALIFLIPISLVSAELASTSNDGIYGWVKQALGEHMGALSIWLTWLACVVWYPTILSYVAVMLSYSFAPDLATSPLYTVSVTLALFWSVLLGNCFGMRFSGKLNTLTFTLGTLIPAAILIGCATYWIGNGNPSHIDFSWNSLIPHEMRFEHLVFLVGVLLNFCGLEMNAVHVKDVRNPRKNFPRALFLAVLVILSFSLLGTLSIGIAVPKENIHLMTAALDAISFYLDAFGLSFLVRPLSLLVAFGAFGIVSSWLIGTSRGLAVATQGGYLPAQLNRTNRHDAPFLILLMQGVIVSLLTLVYFVMPDVNGAYWILTALSSQLYLLMYLLLFLSAMLIRLKQPHNPAVFSIPGGKRASLCISGLGLVSCFIAFLIGFIPPPQIDAGNLFFYEAFLIFGLAFFCSLPALLRRFLAGRQKAPIFQ